MNKEDFERIEAHCLSEIERNKRIRCPLVAARWERQLESYRKIYNKQNGTNEDEKKNGI